MSYNIDTWKTKELTNFRIPMSALHYKEDYIDRPTLDPTTSLLTFTGRAECFELRGTWDGDWLAVEYVTSYGEGSGSLHEYLKDHVFPHSTGTLIAVLVWARGDTIERLTVRDGEIEEEEIEL